MTASTIAGAALTGGSMVANSIASNKQAAARDQALWQNRYRQAALDAQIAPLQADALAPYANFGAGQDAKASQLVGLYNGGNIGTATGPNAAPTGVMPTSANTTVQGEDAKQAGIAKTFADQQGAAKAKVDATGQTLFDANINRAQDQTKIGMLDGFKTGYANLLPGDLDVANQSAAGMKSFADVLKGAGSIGIAAGLTPGKTGANAFQSLFDLPVQTMAPQAGGLEAVKGLGSGFSLF